MNILLVSFLSHLDRFLAQIADGLITLYQATLSPDKGPLKKWLSGTICAHYPHCSAYCKECFQKYGFLKGFGMSVERVISCTPSSYIKYDPSSYKVVFFSSAPIGISFLQALKEDKKFEVVGVVSMPDAAAGRGLKIQENPIKKYAKEIGLSESDIQTPRSLQLTSAKYGTEAAQFQNRLFQKQPDFLVVIAYGKIIPQEILDIPKVAPINVHGSLLPTYRGASPLQSVFLDDQSVTGITIMVMNKNLDEGDILSKKEIHIPLQRTAKDLIEKMKEIGPRLLLKTMRSYGKGHIEAKQQEHTQATFSSKIEKSDGLIDPFTESLQSIYNKRRAYILRPKITFSHLGKGVLIEKIIIDKEKYSTTKDHPLILNTAGELNGAVTKLLVTPNGKKTITREEYIRGYIKK